MREIQTTDRRRLRERRRFLLNQRCTPPSSSAREARRLSPTQTVLAAVATLSGCRSSSLSSTAPDTTARWSTLERPASNSQQGRALGRVVSRDRLNAEKRKGFETHGQATVEHRDKCHRYNPGIVTSNLLKSDGSTQPDRFSTLPHPFRNCCISQVTHLYC